MGQAGEGSPAMRRLGVMAALTIQPVAGRPRLFQQLVRSGALTAGFPLPVWRRRGLDCTCRTAHGRRVWRLAPRRPAPDAPVVLFLHGGAYVCGILPPHWRFVTSLARGGAIVEVPLYALAPHAGIGEALALLEAVVRDLAAAYPGRALTLMGDSAGGGLALSLALHLRDSGAPLPRQLVLIAPWVDIGCHDAAVDERLHDDPMLARASALVAANAWASGTDPGDPRLSPMFADLTGLPAIDIYQGTRDMLRPQAEALAGRLRAAGVAADLALCPGGLHDYVIFDVPEGRAAAARIAARLPRGSACQPAPAAL